MDNVETNYQPSQTVAQQSELGIENANERSEATPASATSPSAKRLVTSTVKKKRSGKKCGGKTTLGIQHKNASEKK